MVESATEPAFSTEGSPASERREQPSAGDPAPREVIVIQDATPSPDGKQDKKDRKDKKDRQQDDEESSGLDLHPLTKPGRATVERRAGTTTPWPNVFCAGAHATPGAGVPFVGLGAASILTDRFARLARLRGLG